MLKESKLLGSIGSAKKERVTKLERRNFEEKEMIEYTKNVISQNKRKVDG